MLSLTRLISWRYLRGHTTRLLLAVASIALGVATLTASRILNHSTMAAVETTSTQLSGLADLQITNGEQGVELSLLPRVQSTPGVDVAVPLLARLLTVKVAGGAEQRALLLAVDLSSEQKARDYEALLGLSLSPGDMAVKPWQAPDTLLGVPLAVVGESLWKTQGKPFQLQVLTPNGWQVVSAQAPLKLEGAGNALGGHLLAMKLGPAFQYLLQPGAPAGAPQFVTYLNIKLAPGANRASVQQALSVLVGDKGRVHPPETRDSRLEDVLGGVQMGLMLGATVALFVGMFLVYNTLAVTVAERRHDIGIMRALGATRAQIRGLFTTEALILGLVGSLLGLGGGLVLASFSMETVRTILIEQFSTIELRELAIPPTTIFLGLAAGMGASLVASLRPSAAAAAEPPSDALRRVPTFVHPFEAWWPLAAAMLLAASGVILNLQREHFAPRVATYVSLYLVGLAFMLATPFLARLGVALLRPVARLLGTGGRLAADDLTRSPARTGLTVGKLALGLAMTIQTAGIITSTKEPIFTWIEGAIRANLFVTSGSAITAGGGHTLMKEELGGEIAAHRDVADIMPIRLRMTDFAATQVRLCALPFETYGRHNQVTLTAGKDDDLPRLLDPATRSVLISDNFAVQHGTQVGDTLELNTGTHGKLPWRVIGTVRDYSWNRGTIFIDRAVYLAWFGDALVDTFDVFVREGADPGQVRRELDERLGGAHQLVILNRDEFGQHIHHMIDQFYGLIYANAFMALAVSFLGVANTLAISVLQRRRELGLLRAVGATRWQVAWSVAAQALLIGLLGLLLGIGLGALMQEFVLRVLMVEETGYFFAFIFPVTMTLATAAFALTAAQIAGALPAMRAASLPVSEAVAYE
jgi:putative ABC transport system permease protein